MTNVLQVVVIMLGSLALPGSLLVGYAIGARKAWRWWALVGYVVYDTLYSLCYWLLMRIIVD